jgi:hypothetical protein
LNLEGEHIKSARQSKGNALALLHLAAQLQQGTFIIKPFG